MKRTFLILISPLLTAFACHADLASDVDTALGGKEVNNIRIDAFGFHIKPIRVTRSGGGALVQGQLSHRIAGKPDDQIFYTIRLANKTSDPEITFQVNNGGSKKFVPKLGSKAASGATSRDNNTGWEAVMRQILELIAYTVSSTL